MLVSLVVYLHSKYTIFFAIKKTFLKVFLIKLLTIKIHFLSDLNGLIGSRLTDDFRPYIYLSISNFWGVLAMPRLC